MPLEACVKNRFTVLLFIAVVVLSQSPPGASADLESQTAQGRGTLSQRPSPDGARGDRVVAPDRAVWSFGAPGPGGRFTLRNGVHVKNPSDSGVEFAIKNDAVYLRSSDNKWWVWNDGWSAAENPFPPPLPPQRQSTSLRSKYTEAQLALNKGPDGRRIEELIEYFAMDANMQKRWQPFGDPGYRNGEVGQKIVERRTFPEYGPVPFVKIVSGGFNPDGGYYNATTITSWRYQPRQALEDAWLTYTIMFDPDVKLGFAETGMKLPGFESQNGMWGGFSVRTGTLTPNLQKKPVDYAFRTYEYRPDTGAGYGESVATPVALKEGVLYTIDLRVKLNTPKDVNNIRGEPASWNADGIREIWVDDQLVRFDKNVVWRINPAAAIQLLFFNIYHGGMTPPNKPIHFWVGPVMLSKIRGGMLGKVGAQPSSKR